MLYFTVPRVVAVSPQMRLVEDNPASMSLLDIYKQVKFVACLVFRETEWRDIIFYFCSIYLISEKLPVYLPAI